MIKYLEQRHKVPNGEYVVLHKVLEVLQILDSLVQWMVVEFLLKRVDPCMKSVEGLLWKVGWEGVSIGSHD